MTFQDLMDSFFIGQQSNNVITYQRLLKQMDDRVTPVIGAGLSCWAGYPLWKRLLSDLAKGSFLEGEVEELLNQEEYEQAASALELKGVYEHNEYLRALSEAFSPNKLQDKTHPAYQRWLDRLFPGPFVTTNFDVSLERLLNAPHVITPESPFEDRELQSRIQRHDRMLIKLHGTVDDPEHMILTKERYDETYGPDPENPDLTLSLPEALRKVFNGAPPLFLGCGLGPDRTCSVFRACKGASGFALVELPEETENKDNPFKPNLIDENGLLPALSARRGFLDSLNLDVIWYPHGKHEAVGVLIEQLAKDRRLFGGPSMAQQREAIEEEKYVGSPHFLGRDNQVRKVVEWLKDPAGTMLVHGMAGIGKTEICKAAYREMKQQDPSFTMPMIDLAEASYLPEFLACLASGLGWSLGDLAPEDVLPALLARIRASERKPIAYLDNFEDAWPDDEEEQSEMADTLRSLTLAGLRLLVSSQIEFQADRSIPIGTLDGKEAAADMEWDAFCSLDRVRLFVETLGREVKPEERPALIQLTREMAGHPLSIVLTAGFGRLCGSLDELLEHWHEIDHHIPGEPETHKSLTRAFALTWNGARQNRAAALRWALHAHSLYPLDRDTLQELRGKLPESFTDMDWLEGERRLRGLGLIGSAGDTGERMLLSVKKVFPRLEDAQVFDRKAFDAWTAWGGELLRKADDRKHPEYYARHDRALTWLPQCWHLAESCLHAKDFGGLDVLLASAGNLYQYDISRALPLLQRMLRETPKAFRLKGQFHERFGDLLRRTGKLDEALAAFAEAEQLYEDEQDNLGRANVLKSRGELLSRTGKPDEALEVFAEAEKLYEDEQNNLGRANVLRARGDLLRRTGKLDEALAAYVEAEQLYAAEQDNLGRANVLQSRGDLLRRTGKPDEALAAYAEAERLYEDEQNNLGRANVLQSRGELLSRTGKPDEALAAYAEAEQLFVAEQDNLGRANVLQSRGDLLQSKEDWAHASACYEEAVPLYRAEQESMGLCYTLSELLLCKMRLGKEEEAGDLAGEIMELLPGQTESVQRYVIRKLLASGFLKL